MKLRNCLLLFLVLLSQAIWGDPAFISDLEGNVLLEHPGTERQNAEINNVVQTGDTLYTGSGSYVEIALNSESTIFIDEDTVFNVGERADPEAESRKRGFFRVLLGSVKFKFRKLTNEPDVGTPLALCAVRGTDFTVYTAPDGASMTVVSDGLVEVSAGGKSALLAADEGVEVIAGLGLGEPFDAKTGFVRYDAFAKQAISRIDRDPVNTVIALKEELIKYISEGSKFKNAWQLNFEEQESVTQEVAEILAAEGSEAANQAYFKFQKPLQNRGLDLDRTYRYYLVSGLYLRRYVLSSYYVRMRTRYLTDNENIDWLDFHGAYNEIIDLFDTELVPLLVEGDL